MYFYAHPSMTIITIIILMLYFVVSVFIFFFCFLRSPFVFHFCYTHRHKIEQLISALSFAKISAVEIFRRFYCEKSVIRASDEFHCFSLGMWGYECSIHCNAIKYKPSPLIKHRWIQQLKWFIVQCCKSIYKTNKQTNNRLKWNDKK